MSVYRSDRPDGANASITRAQTARSWIDCLQTFTQNPSYRLLPGPEGPPSIAIYLLPPHACILLMAMHYLLGTSSCKLCVNLFVFLSKTSL